MSILSGILKLVAGAAEIAAGALVEVGTLGGGTPLALMLIGSGAGMLLSGIGTLISGDQVKGYATTTRNSIAPWDGIYGEARVGGTIVYMNTWGDNDQMLDMVVILAAHPCESIDEILFDQQRVQIDTTAIPTTGKAGFPIATPVAGSGTSFTPVQQSVNIASVTRSAVGVVTVVLNQDIPFLSSGDQVTVENISTDATLNGVFEVAEIISRVLSGGTQILTFTYLNGGAAEIITGQGKVVTRWPDYGRNVYVEYLTGAQTLGETFVGMTAGTPWQGTGKLVTPASPQNAGGKSLPNQWTNFCSLQGKTAVFIRLQYVQKYFPEGIPQISFHVKGKNDILDPRIDSRGYTTNAALCIADFLSNTAWGFKGVYSVDIPLDPLRAAADVCDEPVDVVIGGTEPRYSLNGRFNLQSRRGEILQNLLTACAGRLTYFNGQYVINPGQWVPPLTPNVDLQAIAAGPMKWRPTVSIRDLYNGVKGTYISPFNSWQSTDFPAYAQDANHGYDPGNEFPEFQGDINLAADGGDRRWLDIQLPFTISSGTAQRLAKIELLRRRHVGTGTFSCNMAAYQYVPLDVISADSTFLGWTGKELEVSAVRLRSDKAPNGQGWILGTELDLQETDSDIYVWSTEEELSPQGYVISTFPRNTVVESLPYPWSPGYVAPLTGDAFGGAASFGLQPLYGTAADNTGIISMQIKGTSPINDLDREIASPLILVTSDTTSGNLEAGDYAVALTARDAGAPPYKLTDYQAIGHANIPSGSNGSITTHITWGSGDDGGDLYIAKWTPFEDGFVFHHNATVSSGASTATITNFNQATAGGIDTIFDHFSVVMRGVVHSGPWAQVISAVTSTTITIPGPTTASMTDNQWAGYSLALLAKADTSVEIPLLFIPIASSTASAGDGTFTLTVGPNGLGHTLPDLTTLLQPGDLVCPCFNATFTSSSMTDPNIANAFFPGGADGTVDAGHVAVVMTGADAGDTVSISGVSDDGTTFNLATSWAVTPSPGDLIFICQPANEPESFSAKIKTSSALVGAMANPNVLNYANATWLFRVRTEDVDNNYNDDSLTPWRIAYIFGAPGIEPQIEGEWAPFQVQASGFDALWPDEWTFYLDQSYKQLADGSQLAQSKVTGKVTVNSFIPNSVAPVLQQSVTQTTTGGTVTGGNTIYVAVCGENSAGYLTPPSNTIEVVVPPGTDTNAFTITDVIWPSTSGLDGHIVFASTHKDLMCAQTSGGGGTPSSITFNSTLQRSTWALPNPDYSFNRVKYKLLLHGGVQGSRVDVVSGSTITCRESIDVAGTDDWSGRQIVVIGRNGTPGVAPFASYNITAFAASTGVFTLDRSASSIQVGDAVVVTMKGYDNSSDPTVFTDAGLSNAQDGHAGLVVNGEVGNIVRVIAGTNRGATAHIISNTSTSYTFDVPLPVNTDSVLIVEEPIWRGTQDFSAIPNANPQLAVSTTMDLTNYLRQSVLVGGFTVSSSGTESPEPDIPVRMLYLYGQQNPPAVPPQATLILGRNMQGGAADIVLASDTNQIIAKVGGKAPTWDAVITEPPIGTSLTVDIYQNGGVIGTVTLGSGNTTLQSGAFTSTLTVAAGDLFYGVVTQVGSITPGRSATIQLYWSPQAPIT